MIGDLLSLLGLAKELRGALRRLPDGVGFSIVNYPGSNNRQDHLRIINLTPLTIHGFKCAVQIGEHGESTPVTHLYHPAPADVYGRPALFRLDVPRQGIYLRPGSPFFIPLHELPHLKVTSDSDMRAAFSYTVPDGARRDGKLQYIVRVEALSSTDHVENTR